MRILSEFKDYETHRSIAKRQRDAYNLQKNSLDNDTILIELDWKQKILIGN